MWNVWQVQEPDLARQPLAALADDAAPVFCALHHVWKMVPLLCPSALVVRVPPALIQTGIDPRHGTCTTQDETVFGVWMEVLRSVPNSRLRLQECAPEARQLWSIWQRSAASLMLTASSSTPRSLRLAWPMSLVSPEIPYCSDLYSRDSRLADH